MKAGSPVLVETSLGTVALAYASAARNKWSQCKPFRKWQWHCIKALHESVMLAVPLHETIPHYVKQQLLQSFLVSGRY